MENKIVNFFNNIINHIITIFFIILLLIGLYFTYDTGYVFYQANSSKITPTQMIKEQEKVEKALSPNVKALFSFDNTNISYPILQGKNNTEYLDKNCYDEYSLSGAIFMDARNSPDFSDDYTIIYGHHMSDGFMFGALDDFKKENFFNSHKTGSITINNKNYKLNIFAVLETDAKTNEIFNIEYSCDRIKYAKENAKFYREPTGKRVIAFTTCQNATNTMRTVVLAEILDD